MVRSWWLGPLVLTMAGGGTVWAQSAPERSGTAGATRDRFMTVTEQGKSPTRCRIIQSGTLADGSKVYLVSAVDDGHRITVVQPGRKADGALPATRFYHWTKDNRPPAGVPALMAQDEKPADTFTATEARPFPVPANLGAAEGSASVVKKVVSNELPLTTDGSQPVVVKNEVVTLGEEGSKGKVVDVGPSETSSKGGKGSGQGAGAGTKGFGKGADAGAGTKGAGNGGGKAADPGAGQAAGDGTKGAGHGGLGILGGLGGHGGQGSKAADAGAGTKGAGQAAGDGTKGAGTKGAGQAASDGTKGAGTKGVGQAAGDGTKGAGTKGAGQVAGDGTKGAGTKGAGQAAGDGTKGAGTKGAGQAAGDGTKGAGTKGAGQATSDGTKGAGKAADAGAGTKGSGKAADAGAGTKGAGKAADAGAGLKGHGLGDGGMKGGDLGGGTGKGAADASKLPRSVADALDPLNRPLEFQKPVKEKGEAGETVMEKLRKALGLRAGDEASGRGGRDGRGGRLGRGSMEAAGVTGDFTVGQPFPVMLGTPPTPVPTQANIPKPPYMAYIPGPEANPYVPRPDVGVAPGYANAFTLTNTSRPIPADFGNQPMQQNAFATPLPSGPQPTAFAAVPQQGYPQGLPPGMQLPPGMTPGQLPPGMLPPGMLPPGMGAPAMSTPLQSLPQPHAAAAGAGGFAKKKKADKNFDDGSTNAFTSVPQVAPQPVGIVPLNTPLLGRANPATGVQTVNAEIRKVNLEQPVRQLRESLLPSEREKAIDEIGQANLEANTDAASALLTAAFRDPALSVRLSAIRTLGTKLSSSPQVLGALRALMDDPDVRIRAEVEQVLAPANTQLPTPPSQPRTLKGGK